MKKIVLSIFSLILLVTQAHSQSKFFEQTSYVGAFGKIDWTSNWCNWNPQNTNYASTSAEISSDITSNTTLTKDKVYLLKNFVYVKNGATLTIEAGTVIRADKASKASLIITRGSKLIAKGTSTEPIVFTSNENAGSRNYGDWGGIIILGKGVINPSGGEAAIEGGVDNVSGDGKYGGTDNNDNSGSLEYVRIEFPGIAFQPNSEINGLTLGGVGSGTTVNHIQVSYSGDDSYEWFGGMVNTKYLVAFKGWDDDFDCDFGYSGYNQFLVSLRDSAKADQSGSNGFEIDNDGTGSSATPYTSAIFSNVTIIGPKVDATNPLNSNFKRGMHIRRNCKVSIFNSIITGFPVGFLMDGAGTYNNFMNNDANVRNCVFAGCTKKADTAGGISKTAPTFDINAWSTNSTNANIFLTASSDVNLEKPFDYNAPDFRPTTSSSVNSGADFTNSKLQPLTFTSLSNKTENEEIALFPNPTNNIVNIFGIEGNYQVKLTSLTGEVIFNDKVSGNYQLGLENLTNGYYIIQLTTKDSYISKSIIKQ